MQTSLNDLIQEFSDIRVLARVSCPTLGKASGYHPGTIRDWENRKSSPSLVAFIDCLHVMGYHLTIEKSEDDTPKENVHVMGTTQSL